MLYAASTKFSGTKLFTTPNKESNTEIVFSLESGSKSGSGTTSVTLILLPGLMVATKTIPRITANKVVVVK